MSVIQAGNTTTTSLIYTGDTTGNLVFTTGGANTVALTLANTQAATFANNVSITGSVGIGTATPSYKLAIQGNTNGYFGEQIYNSNASSSAVSYLQIGNNTSGAAAQLGLNSSTNTTNFGGANGLYLMNGVAAPLAFGVGNAEKMRLDTNGALLVNQTSSSNFKMRINGIASLETGDGTDGANYGIVQMVRPATQSDNVFWLSFIRSGNKVAGMGFLQNSDTFAIQNQNNNSGSGVTLTAAATSWGTTSDERKKDIVGNVDNALDKLANWRSVYFKYKTDDEGDPQRVGLIAQDVQATLPEAVAIEQDEIGTLQLRYTETIPLLVKAIQELKAELDAAKAEIKALKEK